MSEILRVPKSLSQSQPLQEITAAERAVAWEIATILYERRKPIPDRNEGDMLVLDVPSVRLRGPDARDDNQHLHRVLQRLARVQWADQEADGRRYVVQLIAEAEISTAGDIVRLWLPPRAVRFLRSPTQFAKLDRAAAYSLPPNARALYGLLKDRFAQPDNLKHHTADYTLDELKGHLQLGGRYKAWDNFKKWVLVPSVKAINDTGALNITWEPIKWGRRITGVRFRVRLKQPAEADKAEHETERHSAARGKEQETADAPPLVVTDAALHWLDRQSNTEKARWAKRARALGADNPSTRNPHVWIGWVADEITEHARLNVSLSDATTDYSSFDDMRSSLLDE